MYCPKCGYENTDSAVFCGRCGKKLADLPDKDYAAELEKSNRSRTILIVVIVLCLISLLAIFLLNIFRGEEEKKGPAPEDVAAGRPETLEINIQQNAAGEGGATAAEAVKADHVGTAVSKGHKVIPVADVYASTYLVQKKITHYPTRVVDGDLKTAWAEGSDSTGVGDYLDFDFGQSRRVEGIKIWAGYHKSQKLYYANNRPAVIELILPGYEDNFVLEIKDRMEPQTFAFPYPVDLDSIRLQINRIYPGNSYNDTCISEVEFY